MFVVFSFHFLELVLERSMYLLAFLDCTTAVLISSNLHGALTSVLNRNLELWIVIDLLKSIFVNLSRWFVLPISEGWNTWDDT